MIRVGKVLDWLSYTNGALIKMADLASSTVKKKAKIRN